MSESVTRSMITELFESLERTRDELRVQAHLGKEEAKGQWEKLESRFSEVKKKRHQAFDALEETGEGVLEGLKASLEELHKGYKKFRDLT